MDLSMICLPIQMVENSSGITEEPLPDLTTLTLGSELSLCSRLGNEHDDSTDSLHSFEKHEMSETEGSLSLQEDSLRGWWLCMCWGRGWGRHYFVQALNHLNTMVF